MKKISVLVVCSFILFFTSAPSFAQIGYSKDFLEVGNPGGWCGSLKTFEETWTVNVGDTVDLDIWITDVPEESPSDPAALLSGGFFIYNPSPLVNITNIMSYVIANGGPWDTSTVIEIADPPGWLVVVSQLECAEIDGDGGMILAKVTLECQGPGDAELTVLTIADFATVAGCEGTIYDYQITPHIIAVHPVYPTDTDEDGIIDFQDNCPEHPNGPASGTCVRIIGGLFVGVGVTCTVSEDCLGDELCDLAQLDSDESGIGDACECRGNFDGDRDIDGTDFIMFKMSFGRGGYNNPCPSNQ